MIESKKKRIHIWNTYQDKLKEWAKNQGVRLPHIPEYATNNAHLFYIVTNDSKQRDAIINHLKANGVLAIFHYLSLHQSPYYREKHGESELLESDFYTNALIRLPLFYDLTEDELSHIIMSLLSVNL